MPLCLQSLLSAKLCCNFSPSFGQKNAFILPCKSSLACQILCGHATWYQAAHSHDRSAGCSLLSFYMDFKFDNSILEYYQQEDPPKRGKLWRPEEESLLLELKKQNTAMQWKGIQELFNSQLPKDRHRSLDSIYNKWRSLKPQFENERAIPDPPTIFPAAVAVMDDTVRRLSLLSLLRF